MKVSLGCFPSNIRICRHAQYLRNRPFGGYPYPNRLALSRSPNVVILDGYVDFFRFFGGHLEVAKGNAGVLVRRLQRANADGPIVNNVLVAVG